VDRSPLREHDVRLIVGAVGISSLGDFLLWIPLTLRIQEISGSGLAIAGLFLALWTPLVVLAPVAGLMVDRRDARAVLDRRARDPRDRRRRFGPRSAGRPGAVRPPHARARA
jgi:hypothetical protein